VAGQAEICIHYTHVSSCSLKIFELGVSSQGALRRFTVYRFTADVGMLLLPEAG
jgi:hypothetical protein